MDHVMIEIELEYPQDIIVEIFDNNQKVVEVLHNGYIGEGQHSIVWDKLSRVSSANYYLRIRTTDGAIIEPLIKL